MSPYFSATFLHPKRCLLVTHVLVVLVVVGNFHGSFFRISGGRGCNDGYSVLFLTDTVRGMVNIFSRCGTIVCCYPRCNTGLQLATLFVCNKMGSCTNMHFVMEIFATTPQIRIARFVAYFV